MLQNVYLTVVISVRNASESFIELIKNVGEKASNLASDYDIIIVDNGSTDDTLLRLKQAIDKDGIPNVQVFALTKTVEQDVAYWVGVENALGDYVVVYEPQTDAIEYLETMLAVAISGSDVVLASNEQSPRQSFAYRVGNRIFNAIFNYFNGLDLSRDAPVYRILSRSVINYLSQHLHPQYAYRYLPAKAGFICTNLSYSSDPQVKDSPTKTLSDAIHRGIRLLVSTSVAPMRIATLLAMLGAVSNFIYSIYVLMVGTLKSDVAPGWVSLSLQQSGTFVLLSLVLLVMSEYILHITTLTGKDPSFHVAKEFMSSRISRNEKLNVETVVQASEPVILFAVPNE